MAASPGKPAHSRALRAKQKGNTMSRNLTISGVIFKLDDPYAEGHTCSAEEARALNQTRAENIRNNFASTVKETLGEATEATDAQLAELQKKLTDYAKGYVFNASGGGRAVDPIEKEARRLATAMVDAAMAKKGIAKSTYLKEQANKDKYAANVSALAATDGVLAKAKAAVKEMAKLSEGVAF